MSFFLNTKTTVRVPMMSQGGGFNFREDKSVQVLEMPYTGKDFSMVILLPRERDGLRNLEDSLTADAMEKWTSGLFPGGIEVLLPKFTVTHRLTLDAVLKEMGVTDAFDPREADFSGMDGRAEWLNIGSVLHQAFVIVDEEGTEAAAATSGGGCFPSGTVVLTADGARPIEKIESGTRVASCDPATGAWTLATVIERQESKFEGDLIAIRAGSVSVRAAGNHPFLVIRGDRLAWRPRPRDIPDGESVATSRGRWVEARDLVVGDVLEGKAGEGLAITGLSSRQEKLLVYNLDVEGCHTYAVHQYGILVHNKGKAEPRIFQADHPFLFLIRENSTGTVLFMGRVSNPSPATAPTRP